jgi:excisionase family DNA binding protein
MTEVRLLSRPQVAERLGVDVRTVRKMIGLGQLPHVRVGDRPMVPEVAVERFIEVASAASIGTQTALRIFTQTVAALQEAPHVTEEDGT